MFTDEEIKTAKQVRDTIIKEDISELKSIYMAGEIVMWAEMQAKNISSSDLGALPQAHVIKSVCEKCGRPCDLCMVDRMVEKNK